ncbi:MAG: 16S rRNA processing protein RimM [Chloroflexia bacterium]|nr:16S rRNA processing protein RimM [Chloroflexia bacterium]
MASETSSNESSAPVDNQASSTGDSRPRQATPRQKPARTKSRSLIDTAGPDPDATLDRIKLTVGVIGGTHGVQGELKLKLLTDHPEHLSTISQVFLGASDEPTNLLGVRFHGDQALIQLEGVSSPEQGKLLGGLKVRIAGSDAKPLEEGEYFLFQLIGLAAVTSGGEPIGTVTDILETGAHDVLTIKPESGPDILVPNHPRFVLEIAPERNEIVIDPPVYAS